MYYTMVCLCWCLSLTSITHYETEVGYTNCGCSFTIITRCSLPNIKICMRYRALRAMFTGLQQKQLNIECSNAQADGSTAVDDIHKCFFL